MKNRTGIALALLVAAAVGAAYWLGLRGAGTHVTTGMAGQGTAGESGMPRGKILYYRNPMGLPDTSPVPKKDPMGMDYVPVYEDVDDLCAVPGKACKPEVRISSEKIQKLGVRVEPVERRELDRVVRAVATTDASERLTYGVAPRYEGWIEKVYVNAIYQLVKKGEPLIEVYSPELRSAQQEYVIAAEAVDRIKRDMAGSSARLPAPSSAEHAQPAAAGAMADSHPVTAPGLAAEGIDNVSNANDDALAGMERLAESVLDRLRNWDISEEQIQELKRTRKAKRTLIITAPARSYVIAKPKIFEGMAFRPGQDIYTLADLMGKMWVIAEVFEQDMSLLRMGQPARVIFDARAGQEFAGRIDYIYPVLNAQTRTTRVRIELDNPTAEIYSAMYANVEFPVGKGRGPVLAVPLSAVISSGTRDIVLVQLMEGRYQPREVKLGMRGDSHVEVRDGLVEGERVVTSANFLIDSESSLKAALTSFGGDLAEGAAVTGDGSTMKHEMPAPPAAAAKGK